MIAGYGECKLDKFQQYVPPLPVVDYSAVYVDGQYLLRHGMSYEDVEELIATGVTILNIWANFS
jgi:hypothetical protein